MAKKRNGPHRVFDDILPCSALEQVEHLLDAVKTPLASHLAGLMAFGRWHEIVDLEIDPNDYVCGELFREDWLVANILSKYPSFALNIDTEKVAYDKFRAAEHTCALTNNRLKEWDSMAFRSGSTYDVFHKARVKISRLLGECSVDDVMSHSCFSGGASTRLPRRQGDAYWKFQGIPEVSYNCAELAVRFIASVPHWHAKLVSLYGSNPNDWVKLVVGNRVTTVPKNAKTDRVIAIEPDLNMLLQKGIGSVMRHKLQRVGIDLNDQTKNQRLARLGSIDGSLATIDLSAASDSISIELVRWLLPPDWFSLLEETRCVFGDLDGTRLKYEKLSSMGNGFTFELESLIFWALSESVVEITCGRGHPVSIYGDDIIVPSAAAELLIGVLAFAGFSTNKEKTFISGPFRESCGKHFFHGKDVTPLYIRKPIDTNGRIIWFANQIRRWASGFTTGPCDPRYKSTYESIVCSLPPKLRRPVIPDGVGDGGLIGDFSEVRPRLSRKTHSYLAYHWVSSQSLRAIDGEYAYLRTLMYGGMGGRGTTLVVPRHRDSHRLTTVNVSQWQAPYWSC